MKTWTFNKSKNYEESFIGIYTSFKRTENSKHNDTITFSVRMLGALAPPISGEIG